jgi:hypothetical protein
MFSSIFLSLRSVRSLRRSIRCPVSSFAILPTFHTLGIGYKNLDGFRDDKAGIPTKSQFSPKVPLRRAWKKAPIRDHPRFIRG